MQGILMVLSETSGEFHETADVRIQGRDSFGYTSGQALRLRMAARFAPRHASLGMTDR